MTIFLVVLAAALLSIAKEQRASERVTEKWILGSSLPQPQRQRRPTRTTTATHAHKQHQTTSLRGGTFGGFTVGSSGGLNVGSGSSTILGTGKATTLTRPNRHVLRANKRREYVGPTGRILKNPVHLNVSHSRAKTVRDYGGDGAISKYMQLPVEQYIMLNESMICRMADKPNSFELKVPKLKILSIWCQPKVEMSVQTLGDRVLLKAGNCNIDGSPSIIKMGLNERFEFESQSEMKWDTNGESADVEILGSVQVW
eukprot:CAMPEP_0197521328 /NCGR_PEP_ID=MMETSP1318-20131121/6608_1 /TAXON_ID=552666 /ORGANISM="Partenskyella glossopodia, Strain RCC365" /LENGTH=255 /DNA_ID=CAMNT_0043073267 /DNA_START=67 /DNA_END=831 /DNA_ORIENTATION=+